MQRLLLVVLCVCSVNSYMIVPLPVQSTFPQETEISTESGNADTVVYTNLPTSSDTEVEVATTPTAKNSSETILISKSLVSAVAETKNLSELIPESTANSYTASDSLNQSETIDVSSLPDSEEAITTPTSNTKLLSASESTTRTNTSSSEASLSESLETTTISIESLQTSTSKSVSATSPSLTGSKTSESQLETGLTENVKTSTTLSNSEEVSESSESPNITNSSSPSTVTDSSADTTTVSSSSDSETDSYTLFETTTEDLSFLSVDLLPPKLEFRKYEPDPRYDY